MITIHQRYRQTDRQTDRQTTCDRNTALCTKVHRAVKMHYVVQMEYGRHSGHDGNKVLAATDVNMMLCNFWLLGSYHCSKETLYPLLSTFMVIRSLLHIIFCIAKTCDAIEQVIFQK